MMKAFESLLSELQHIEKTAWEGYMNASVDGVSYAEMSAFYSCWRSARQAIILAERLKKGEKDEQ